MATCSFTDPFECDATVLFTAISKAMDLAEEHRNDPPPEPCHRMTREEMEQLLSRERNI